MRDPGNEVESRELYVYSRARQEPIRSVLRWNGTLYMYMYQRPIVCYNNCTHEQKMNFEGFTQNGCYGNQHTAF